MVAGATEQYLSYDEYRSYYPELNGLRHKVASDLPIFPNTEILDLATGFGYFAIEVARREIDLSIVGIDISQNDVANAKVKVEESGLSKLIAIIRNDSTAMGFSDEKFDLVVNFTGLEDIHMTRGRIGVERTLMEVNRILKPDHHFCFVVMPPDQMETEAQKIEVALYSYICGATWLNTREYEDLLSRAGFELRGQRAYFTGKKLTPEQAKEEIRYACQNVPKIYGIDTRPYHEIWGKFGKDILENGLGCYTKVVLMIAQKKGLNCGCYNVYPHLPCQI